MLGFRSERPEGICEFLVGTAYAIIADPRGLSEETMTAPVAGCHRPEVLMLDKFSDERITYPIRLSSGSSGPCAENAWTVPYSGPPPTWSRSHSISNIITISIERTPDAKGTRR